MIAMRGVYWLVIVVDECWFAGEVRGVYVCKLSWVELCL